MIQKGTVNIQAIGMKERTMYKNTLSVYIKDEKIEDFETERLVLEIKDKNENEVIDIVYENVLKDYEEKLQDIPEEVTNEFEKAIDDFNTRERRFGGNKK